jgi:quercetin dioxygenase-like cupin family protein
MEQPTTGRGAARAPEPVTGPWLAFDLAAEVRHLRQEPYWQSGRNSKTLVHYPDFRMVVSAIRAGTTIQEHRVAGRLSVQTLQGHLRMSVEGQDFDLPAGRLVAVDEAVPYELHAIEDSSFLMTIAWRDGDH